MISCYLICHIFQKISFVWGFLAKPSILPVILLMLLILCILYYRSHKYCSLSLTFSHSEMNDFVVNSTAELQKPYAATPYLTNGNLQTIFYAIRRHFIAGRFGIDYKRQLLQLEDGGQLSLDWPLFPDLDHDLKQGTPIIAIMAGLTGGRHDIYVANMIKEGFKKGYKSVLINQRGGSATPLTVFLD